MTDENLQARAGLNVGNEPWVGSFIAKAGGPVVKVTPNQKVVLLEGLEGVIRTPQLAGNFAQGIIYNPNLDDYDLTFFFEDDEGNEIEIGVGFVTAEGTGSLGVLGDFAQEGGFALCSGEKLKVLATVVVPPPP